MIKKGILILLLTITTFVYIQAQIIYDKKIINQDGYLYLNTKCDYILDRVYKNDEVTVIKEIKTKDNIFHYVETQEKRRGIIKDIISDYKTFSKEITIVNEEDDISLLYDMKTKKFYRKAEKNEVFIADPILKGEDKNYMYYLTSIGFILKINRLSNIKISDVNENVENLKEGEK